MLSWFSKLSRSEKCAAAAIVDDVYFVEFYIEIMRAVTAARSKGQQLMFTRDSIDKISEAIKVKVGSRATAKFASAEVEEDFVLSNVSEGSITGAAAVTDDHFTTYADAEPCNALLGSDPLYSPLWMAYNQHTERLANSKSTSPGISDSSDSPNNGVSSTVNKFCQTAVRNVAHSQVQKEKEADAINAAVVVASANSSNRPDCLFLLTNALEDWASLEQSFRALTNNKVFSLAPAMVEVRQLVASCQTNGNVTAGLEWTKELFPQTYYTLLLGRVELSMWSAFYCCLEKSAVYARPRTSLSAGSADELTSQEQLSQSPLLMLPSTSAILSICLCVEEIKPLWHSMNVEEKRKIIGESFCCLSQIDL
jgi:hypothetical protein